MSQASLFPFSCLQVEELLPEALGHAGSVYEHTLGDDKYTFIEDVANPHSCTILIKGQNDHTIAQMKDAVRDGLRAVKNVVDDGAVILGEIYGWHLPARSCIIRVALVRLLVEDTILNKVHSTTHSIKCHCKAARR